MRHLRKERPSPRHLRQGLLTDVSGRRTFGILVPAGLVAALAAGLMLALSSCGTRAPAGAGHARASWYELVSTVFQSVGAADASPQVPALPWTVQSRVADMAFLGDTLYCAVNGAGVAAVDSDASGALKFTYHYDAPIFAHRTITTLIPRHGELMIHLYYNALLNDAKPEELLLRGVSLVSFLPGQKDFSFLIPPYQRKNRSGRQSGLPPSRRTSSISEWKYTDSSQTQFAYTRYRADLQLEAGSNRDAYMAALGTASLSGADVPAAYSAFFDECGSRIQGRAARHRAALQSALAHLSRPEVFPFRARAGFHSRGPRPGRSRCPVCPSSGRPGAGTGSCVPAGVFHAPATSRWFPLHGFRKEGRHHYCLMGGDAVHPGGKSGDHCGQRDPVESDGRRQRYMAPLAVAGTPPGWLEVLRKCSRSKTTGSSI